jgi:hypothetical protein
VVGVPGYIYSAIKPDPGARKMSKSSFLKALVMLCLGIVIVFSDYVIVIGQAKRPVLVVLNKAENSLSIIDPVSIKATGTVPTGH